MIEERINGERKKLIVHYIAEIKSYMEENDFQRDFFEALNDFFDKRGNLTEKQFGSLERMYERVTDI